MTVRNIRGYKDIQKVSAFSKFALNTQRFNVASTPMKALSQDIMRLSVPSIVLFQNYWFLRAGNAARNPARDALTQGGFSFDPIGDGAANPLTRTADKFENLLDASLDPEEVSQVLGVSVNEILRRLENRTLYGVPMDDGWKIPRFQFEENQPLPGLEEVLPLLHRELHPIAVSNWFSTPNPDLLVGDNAVSPSRWLLSGRSVAAVARLAIDV